MDPFLLQHALQGWCPPVPILRRQGFRTRHEIDAERQALRDCDSAALWSMGAHPFILFNFVRRVLRRRSDASIVVVDALTYAGNLANLEEVRDDPRLEFVRADIADAAQVAPLVARVDAIVHFAAESHVDRSIEDGGAFVRTNVLGTQVLLDAIRDVPVERFILISSSEVYGTAETAPMDEEHPLNPRSPYAATKAGADRLAYAYYVTYGLPIVIVQPGVVYGPGDPSPRAS